jgi:hypothetical protein
MNPIFNVKLHDGTTQKVPKGQIRKAGEPDVGIIPQTSRQLEIDADSMHKDELQNFLCPEILSKDEEEFMH